MASGWRRSPRASWLDRASPVKAPPAGGSIRPKSKREAKEFSSCALRGRQEALGKARKRSERLGVPPCQQRLSRKMAAPAGSGQRVLNCIHVGSSRCVGGRWRQRCEPGTTRIGPLIAVTFSSTKLICRKSTLPSEAFKAWKKHDQRLGKV